VPAVVTARDVGEAPAERTPTLRHRAEYALLRAFAGLVRLIGLRAGCAIARCAGSAIHRLDRRHRAIARANLRERFRDAEGRPLAQDEVRRIARDSFRHLVVCAVEVLHLEREMRRRGMREIVDVSGREHFDAAIASGRGVILATAHVGNWEVMGALCGELGVTFTTVYRPLDNPLLDRWIRETRAAAGQTMVPKQGALRPLLRALRQGGMVVLLVDQDARGHGVFAPFFGAPASTIPTPAELALRTGATILPAASVRTGPGFRYHAWFDDPVEVRDTGDHDADLVRVMTAVNARLEAAIRRAPEQWLWAHRRWKTQPPA
jgi:Kdo2-lipid IVA lauroyltransferase/acyltransferase